VVVGKKIDSMGVRVWGTGKRDQARKGIERSGGVNVDEHKAKCIIIYSECQVLNRISFEWNRKPLKCPGLDVRYANEAIAGYKING
jgi:hypothetical protein